LRRQQSRLQWLRFTIALCITAITLVPVAVVVLLALRPGTSSSSTAVFTLDNLRLILRAPDTVRWLVNSLAVTLSTVVVCLLVAAPAGYAVSRGRGRATSAYSLLLFVVQSLPVIMMVIPLFILFAALHLVDSLFGVGIVYVGASLAVATWMMTAYIDAVPVSLEHAAWLDGASVFGGFVRIVLRNSLPGLVSTATFTYLVSWNDYLIAVVFIRAQSKYTLPLGVDLYGGNWSAVMALALIIMVPPAIVFAVLNRFFSVGGIGARLGADLS
jgi:multiple sugar transport system permease protein